MKGDKVVIDTLPIRWAPELGDIVWLNYPDFDKPEGKVVGFVEDGHRKGQPIIEVLEDEPPVPGGLFSGATHHKGDRIVIAPLFLLPFQYYGPEWKAAEAAGLIDP